MSRIHPTAVIADGAHIPDTVEIGPFCIIGPKVRIGENVRLISGVTLMGDTYLGDDCICYPNVTLGGAAQILNRGNPNCRVEIGKRNTFRENVFVHGALPDKAEPTRIGDDCFFMANSNVAHDCQISNKCVLANGASIGGECILGDQVWLGGGSFIHQKTWIGAHAFIGGGSILVGDVIPYVATQGNHSEIVTLNVVGLKRRGFSRESIRNIHNCVRDIFEKPGTFKDRIEAAQEDYEAVDYAKDILAFIGSPRSGRPLCGYRRSK